MFVAECLVINELTVINIFELKKSLQGVVPVLALFVFRMSKWVFVEEQKTGKKRLVMASSLPMSKLENNCKNDNGKVLKCLGSPELIFKEGQWC